MDKIKIKIAIKLIQSIQYLNIIKRYIMTKVYIQQAYMTNNKFIFKIKMYVRIQ